MPFTVWGTSDEPSQCFILPDFSGTNSSTPGMDGLVGHGRDQTMDHVRAQRAAYHCTTHAHIIEVTTSNFEEA
ncbi:hypothetical protein Y032_0011g1561 [Ancylostoma ceylanicum]|nr:hypothetical protein Y032_0011g1561 [Ancylostoma ceylanicum]